MAAVAKNIDWEAVEIQYRAGVRSLKDIGAEFGVSDAGIIKKARKEEWVRGIKPTTKKVVLSQEKKEIDRAGFVYVIYIEAGEERFCKIRKSVNFNDRLTSHQCSSPFDVCVAVCYFVGNMNLEEKELHGIYKEKHIRGEWYRLEDEDIREISLRAVLI